MMSVVHSPFGLSAVPLAQREPQPPSVEMYQPPTQIGGGWSSQGDRKQAVSDESSRARTQRTLNRARVANAKGKARALEAPASQVPVVVHVPLPDLDQPIITSTPQNVAVAENHGGEGEYI